MKKKRRCGPGEFGPLRQWAIEHQIKVGRYLRRRISSRCMQAHIMADTESLGVAGVEWLERWTKLPAEQRRVRIPTITDPRGTDFAAAHKLKQQPWMLDLERRAIAAFEALGVLMTDTCINYQTIMPPVRGEHGAYGDTGVVIYSNSVCGARSNFEGGPSALSAGLTGRTPRYGYHLDEHRQATLIVNVDWTPRELNEWGALGGIVGRLAGDYWQVPALVGHRPRPDLRRDEAFRRGAGELRLGRAVPHGRHHAGGAAARRCRRTPASAAHPSTSARPTSAACRRAMPRRSTRSISSCSRRRNSASSKCGRSPICWTDAQRNIPLLAVTSPQVKPDADRMGLTARIEAAGGTVLAGMCFYQSYAREMAEANGWKRLATNSAKLTNILGGYGYRPALLSMERCVDVGL